jgi:hypothetical protein
LDRTQKVLFEIAAAMRTGMIEPTTKVFAPSPSARAISSLYAAEAAHPEPRHWFKSGVYGMSALFPPTVDRPPDVLPPGSIVVTSSGMIDGGTSRALATRLLRRSDVTVFLVD